MDDKLFFRSIAEADRNRFITAIDATPRFPEIVDLLVNRYEPHIRLFCELIHPVKICFDKYVVPSLMPGKEWRF